MRVFVKLCDEDGRKTETYVLACKDVSRAISGLKQEALRQIGSEVEDGERYRLTLAGNGATLRETDTIEDVLRDGDYLCLCTFTSLLLEPSCYRRTSMLLSNQNYEPKVVPHACLETDSHLLRAEWASH